MCASILAFIHSLLMSKKYDRGLQNRELLEGLLVDVAKARDELEPSPITSRRPRLVLKIAPDLQESQIIEMAEVIRNSAIDGVIVSNTTITRPSSLNDREYISSVIRPVVERVCQPAANKSETGGLSGKPLMPYSLQALKTLRAHLPSAIPLIGCGGISSGADALEYARAGASLVQVYTGFGYDGVGTCRRIKDELSSLLKAEGKTWSGVVDEAVRTLSWKERGPQPLNPSEAGAVTIGKLIEEAEELRALLDRLAEKTD